MINDQSTPLLEKYQRQYEKDSSSRVFAPLAESYRKLGLLQEAFDILNKGIKKNPNYSMGYLVLANCYYDKQNFEFAYNTLRPLIVSNRDNFRLQKLFADTCLRINKKDEALETLKYLLFINPKDKIIADQVMQLESNVNPVITSGSEEVPRNAPALFNVSSIYSGPESDLLSKSVPEDWRQVDLSNKVDCFDSSEQIVVEDTPEEQAFAWQVNDVAKVWKRAIDRQTEKTINVNLEDVKTTSDDVDFPVITHTLVDLYCDQGHYRKAKLILEKLLVMDPDNLKTINKIKDIDRLINPKTDELNKSSNSTETKHNLPPSIMNEGRDALMNLLDKKLAQKKEIDVSIYQEKFSVFLNAIKERAEQFRFATR